MTVCRQSFILKSEKNNYKIKIMIQAVLKGKISNSIEKIQTK